MTKKPTAVVLALFLLSALQQVGRRPAAAQEGRLRLNYEATCELDANNSASGYVLNRGAETYHVSGTVHFRVHPESGMSLEGLDMTANAYIPPGQRVLVASAQLPFMSKKGEKCSFDVKDAIGRP